MAKEASQSQQGGLSRQALKEVIERRRQNDLVRKQEFDQLRKIRRCEIPANTNPVIRLPLGQSRSSANPDERVETLKKIDEIEAQMSRQWWKDKHSGMPTSMHSSAELPDSSDTSDSFSPTVMGYCDSELSFQDMPGLSEKHSNQEEGKPPLMLTESSPRVADPDLEEAAIRFANGDDAGAEASLLTALQSHISSPGRVAVWVHALFDLYRLTGQNERFQSAAIDCAYRFGFEAPTWFSTPESLGLKALVPVAMTGQDDLPRWVCPASLTPDAITQLSGFLASALPPTVLDWRAISSFETTSIRQLSNLFEHWCDTPVKLHFLGHEVLVKALKSLTPWADKSVSPQNWDLRMAALRVMGLRDEFELVALDFCVTYEVQPPVWKAALCTCGLNFVRSQHAFCAAPLVPTDEAQSNATGVFSEASSGAGEALVELAGEVVGDAADILVRLQAAREGSSHLLISCARLIRVDFSAAGSLLNWVAAQQGSGCTVQFIDVSRIVSAFFDVIGISEHARVIVRSN